MLLNIFLLWVSCLSILGTENLISRRCSQCHYCSSSECSSFRSCLSLPPSTVAFTLPIVSPLRGSGTSGLASFGVPSLTDTLDVCFKESYIVLLCLSNCLYSGSSAKSLIRKLSTSNSRSTFCPTPLLLLVFINCI